MASSLGVDAVLTARDIISASDIVRVFLNLHESTDEREAGRVIAPPPTQARRVKGQPRRLRRRPRTGRM